MWADKNSSRRRWRLQQDEHDFQHTSPTHYPSWPSPRSHWSATGPKEPTNNLLRQNTPTHTAETCTACCLCCTGQNNGLRRSDWLTAPVRPVATTTAQQAFQKASVPSLVPRTKTPQNTTCMEEKPYTKPKKTTPNRPRTDQQH
jgi:hypothetical protein